MTGEEAVGGCGKQLPRIDQSCDVFVLSSPPPKTTAPSGIEQVALPREASNVL